MANNLSSGKKVISNSIIYTVSGLLQKCFSFFLIPLYTAFLSTEDYGITNLANNFLTTMSFVVSFSIFSAVMRFYVDLKADKERLKRFYGTVVLFTYGSSIVFFIICTCFRNTVSRLLFSGIDFYPVIIVSLISLVFLCQQTIYDNILRSQQRALKASVLSFLYFIITITLNIIFVVVLKLGAIGIIGAMAISNIIYTIYFHIDTIKNKEIYFCFDCQLLKEALKYSIPIMPHNLSTNIASFISSILIGNTVNLASLGVYSIAIQFGSIADTVQGYVNAAYAPWLYERLHEKNDGYKEHIRKIVNMLCAAIGVFLILIALMSYDYILLFVNEKYDYAWNYVPLIVEVYVIKIMYYFYVNVLFYFKKASRLLFTATLSSSILNLVASAILIPLLSVYGSILADGIAMIIRVAIVVFISKKFEDVGLRVKDFIKHMMIISIFIIVGLAPSYLYYDTSYSLVNLCYRAIVALIYISIQLIVYKSEIKQIVTTVRRRPVMKS